MRSWRKPKADYHYDVKDDGSIHITDLNLGGMSVTNDAENVLAAIHEEIKGWYDITGLKDKKVTYTDSEGQVDRLIHSNGEFMRFAPGPGD